MYAVLVPPYALGSPDIKLWDIWLDVQEWRSIKHVDILNPDSCASHLSESNDGNPDRIWTNRSSSGEDAVLHIVEERFHGQRSSAGKMKMVYQDNVRETV